MKNIQMICIVFVSLAFSGTASAGWLDFLNQADDAAETVQNTTSTVKNINNTVDGGSAVAETAQAGLIDTLVKQVGVTSEQAQGGSGALFEMAKKNMSGSDFSQISQAVPGMDGILAAAPKTEPASATGDLLSGIAAASGNSTLTDATSLVNAFEQLDLSGDMVGQFTPVIIDYVKQNGGEHLSNILQAALTGS